MNKRETLGFNAKITPVKPLNDEMTLCKCYVMALGKNRNYSHISKETAEDALPTIYNIPVVGHLYVDEDGEYHMGGHDMTIEKGQDGKYKFKSLCVPFGVVPQQENIHFEEIIDSNGNKETYQVADVILWTGRYPELCNAIYDDEVYFGQSMEINIIACSPLADDQEYTDIGKFSYSALCLLGKSDNPENHVEPCFPMSRVEPYNFSLDDKLFDEMMKEFKKELSNCFGAINFEKGGEEKVATEVLDSVKSDVCVENDECKEFEKTEETKDDNSKENFSNSEDAVIEPTAAEPDEGTDNEQEKTSDETEDEKSLGEDEKSSFSSIDTTMTVNDKLCAIDTAVRSITKPDNEHVYLCRHVSDCDDTFAYVWEESLDNDGKYMQRMCRVKYTIENGIAEIVGEFETVYPRYLVKNELDELEKLKANYQLLKEFQEKRLEEDRIKEYDDVVSEFSDLTDNEEFSLVVENKMSFENAETLREKCYAIRGKAAVVNSTKKPELKFALDTTAKAETEVYGGFFSKYPPRMSGQK